MDIIPYDKYWLFGLGMQKDTLLPNNTLDLKPLPGTGILLMSSGWVCMFWFIGYKF